LGAKKTYEGVTFFARFLPGLQWDLGEAAHGDAHAGYEDEEHHGEDEPHVTAENRCWEGEKKMSRQNCGYWQQAGLFLPIQKPFSPLAKLWQKSAFSLTHILPIERREKEIN